MRGVLFDSIAPQKEITLNKNGFYVSVIDILVLIKYSRILAPHMSSIQTNLIQGQPLFLEEETQKNV